MSDYAQDCYRHLLHRYFAIKENSDVEKNIDKVLSNLHSALESSGKWDEVSLKFTKYRNDYDVEDLFKYFWNLGETHQNIEFDIIPSGKCKDLSHMLMEDGNRFLECKRYSQALDLINLSILHAPHPELSDSDNTAVIESTSHSVSSTSTHEEIIDKYNENYSSTTKLTDQVMNSDTSNKKHLQEYSIHSNHDVKLDTHHNINQEIDHNIKYSTNLDANHDVNKVINQDLNHGVNNLVNQDVNRDVNFVVNFNVNQDHGHNDKHNVNQNVNHDNKHNDNYVQDYRILRLSYSIRAKLLYELKQYEKCLLDIVRAIELGRFKFIPFYFLEMKIKSLMALQTIQENNLKQSLNAHDDIDFSEIIAEGSVSKLKQFMEKFYKCKNHGYNIETHVKKMKDDDLIFAYDNPIPPKMEEINPAIPSISNAIKLEYSPEKGRHMVAARDIKPGEIVIVEKAYSWNVDILNPTATVTFCRSCLSRTAAPLPCPHCSKIVFCSEECRKTGLASLHKIECGFIPTMIDVHSFHLPRVFNIISQVPFIHLKMKLPDLQKEVKEKHRLYHGFDENSVYDSANYQTVYHMEGNFRERSVYQLLHLCTVSFIIVKMLIESKKYFVDEAGLLFEPKEYDIVLLGSVCLDHLCKVMCNSAQIDEYQIKIDDMNNGHDMMKVGSGIFPAVCLFNHSCNPSIMSNSYGTTSVFHAVKFIPAGDAVTYTYDMTYYNHDLEERQKEMIDHYHFSCECEACLGDWKLENKLSCSILSKRKLIQQIDKDPETDIYTEKVKEIEDQMNDTTKMFHSVVMDFKKNQRETHVLHLGTIINTLEFFDKYVELPNYIHFLAQRYLVYLNFGIEMSAYKCII